MILPVPVPYQIPVAYTLYYIGRLVAVCEHRIPGIARKRSPGAVAAGIGYHVAVFRAPLCRHEIVAAIQVIHMGAFQKSPSGALPYGLGGGQLLSGLNVYLALDHSTVALIIGAVGDKVHMTLIKEERGVDAPLIYKDGVRPLPVYVVGIHIEVLMGGVVGGDHVEPPVVEADSGGKHSPAGGHIRQMHL